MAFLCDVDRHRRLVAVGGGVHAVAARAASRGTVRAGAWAVAARCPPYASPCSGAGFDRGGSKLHAVCDGEGRPLILLLSEGQMSDHKRARLVLDALLPASTLIADRGYDSRWFRQALTARGIEPCIPSSKSRKVPYPFDKLLYRLLCSPAKSVRARLSARVRRRASSSNSVRRIRTAVPSIYRATALRSTGFPRSSPRRWAT